MGKTIRKDRRDVKYREGQHSIRYVYKCSCHFCSGKLKSKKAKNHKKEYQKEINELMH